MLDWQSVLYSFKENPRDVHTVPTDKRKPLWFHVSVKNDYLIVNKAKDKQPSSQIKQERKLEQKEFAPMLDLYFKRQEGISVSSKATEITYHQVYWYGIFAEFI